MRTTTVGYENDRKDTKTYTTQGGLKEEMRSDLLLLLRILECRLMLCVVSLAYPRSPPSWAYSPLSRSMPSTKKSRRCAAELTCGLAEQAEFCRTVPNLSKYCYSKSRHGQMLQKNCNSHEPGSGEGLWFELFCRSIMHKCSRTSIIIVSFE